MGGARRGAQLRATPRRAARPRPIQRALRGLSAPRFSTPRDLEPERPGWVDPKGPVREALASDSRGRRSTPRLACGNVARAPPVELRGMKQRTGFAMVWISGGREQTIRARTPPFRAPCVLRRSSRGPFEGASPVARRESIGSAPPHHDDPRDDLNRTLSRWTCPRRRRDRAPAAVSRYRSPKGLGAGRSTGRLVSPVTRGGLPLLERHDHRARNHGQVGIRRNDVPSTLKSECPQGALGTRPLSNDDPLAWYVA